MKEIFDTITIKKGIYKPKETQKIKELKEKRRIHRKDFEKAKKELKQEKKETYINTQKELYFYKTMKYVGFCNDIFLKIWYFYLNPLDLTRFYNKS